MMRQLWNLSDTDWLWTILVLSAFVLAGVSWIARHVSALGIAQACAVTAIGALVWATLVILFADWREWK